MQRRFAILLLLAALYVASAAVVDVVVPPACPNGEEWNLCGRLCEPSCLVQKPNPEFCPRIECTNFTADCRCKDGYVRDTEGTNLCIKPKHCKIIILP